MNSGKAKYKIEHGVPVPPRQRMSYPLQALAVGDSFAVPADRVHQLRMAISQQHRRNEGRRYTVRKQDTGYRCWRMA